MSNSSKQNDYKTSKDLNLNETELRLGLPGTNSPVNHITNDGISLNYCSLVRGTKRGYSDDTNGGFYQWCLDKNDESLKNSGGGGGGSGSGGVSSSSSVFVADRKLECQFSPVGKQGSGSNLASKTQVVGWPPIRSYRRNSMAISTPKTNDGKELCLQSGCLFVKVSMDGAPYLRKLDLKMYGSYVELSLALEKMFSGFTSRHCNTETSSQDKLTRGKSVDDYHPSEYILTYEDKDGDWMLVGDVPWNMFMDTCQRLRIMKSTEAVGLASRAT